MGITIPVIGSVAKIEKSKQGGERDKAEKGLGDFHPQQKSPVPGGGPDDSRSSMGERA